MKEDQKKCKHEFIDIVGLTGSLGKSCKYCDLKEEDYTVEKKTIQKRTKEVITDEYGEITLFDAHVLFEGI